MIFILSLLLVHLLKHPINAPPNSSSTIPYLTLYHPLLHSQPSPNPQCTFCTEAIVRMADAAAATALIERLAQGLSCVDDADGGNHGVSGDGNNGDGNNIDGGGVIAEGLLAGELITGEEELAYWKVIDSAVKDKLVSGGKGRGKGRNSGGSGGGGGGAGKRKANDALIATTASSSSASSEKKIKV